MAKAKNSVTPRGELVKYAREVGLKDLAHDELMRVVDQAMEQQDPRAFLLKCGSAAQEAKAKLIDKMAEPKDMPIDATPSNWDLPPNADPVADVARAREMLEANTGAVDRLTEVLQGPDSNVDPALLAQPPCCGNVEVTLSQALCVEIPDLSEPHTGHVSRHAQLALTGYPLARLALTRMRHKLNKQNARMANGKHVTTPAHALIWLLEQIGTAAGLKG